MMKQPTIRDVAKHAGVSVASVSNVLNNKLNVSNELYRKIMKSIEELNYNPSYLASNLKNNKGKLIGVVLPDLDAYYARILMGIQTVLDKADYYFIVKTTNNSSYLEDEIITSLVNMRVSGIIVVSAHVTNANLLKWAESRSVYVVLADRYIKDVNFCSVVFDNFSLAYQKTKLFLSIENEEIIMLVRNNLDTSDEMDFEGGYLLALEEAGVTPHIFRTNYGKELSFRDIVQIFDAEAELPKVFITTKAYIADSLQMACSVYGHKSEIVCLDGNNDWFKTEIDYYGTKRIMRNPLAVGSRAAEMLLEYIATPIVYEKRRELLPVVREVHEKSVGEDKNVLLKEQGSKIRLLMPAGQIADSIIQLRKNFELLSGIQAEFIIEEESVVFEFLERNGLRNSDFDICLIDLPWYNLLFEKRQLLNLRELVEQAPWIWKSVPENMRLAYLPGGNAHYPYAFPFMTTMQYLYYRRDLFENPELKWDYYRKFGIPLEPPKNWIEFETIAKYFTKKMNPESPVEYGTAIEGKGYTACMSEFYPRQWSYHGKIIGEHNFVMIDSENNKLALKSLYRTYQCTPPECIEHRWDYSRDLFYEGKLAMLMTFATHLPPAGIGNPNLNYNNIGSVRIPGGIPIRGGWFFVANGETKERQSVFEFFKWLASEKTSLLNMLLGGLPPRDICLCNPHLWSAYPWAKDISESISQSRVRESLKNRYGKAITYGLVDTVIADEIRRVLKDECKIDDALLNMKKGIQKLIDM